MLTNLIKRPLAGVFLAGLAFAGTAHADDNVSNSKYLFGDWGGERTRLEDKGITFDFGYGFEAAHNYSGGDRNITRYTDQWKFGASFDLQKLWGWDGAKFNVMITDRNGHDIGADANIGNGYTLLGIAGVILGGGEFTGGRVSPIGAVVGALTLALAASPLLTFMHIPPDWQIGTNGAILIIVLTARALVSRQQGGT